ncbi:phosphotransferase [Pseudomonas syringae]|nr:phosphotransferase [Pseudomonas syringae]MCF5742672.1 phosphotransferase [Pseudomonas syringae]MCF5753021.1 phosphotransferase [Pseudomonas syringae]MCF5757724.1 phosphotransferase [Pseudomonas syringae]
MSLFNLEVCVLNALVFNEFTVTKRYACRYSFIREKYVYENETNLENVLIRGAVTLSGDSLQIPFVVAQTHPLRHEQAARLLAGFHGAAYRTPFTSMDIPKGKMYVERKLVSLLEEQRGNETISAILALALETCTELVLCHGDFSPRNIIVGDLERLYLIDFEAVTLGPRAFDIAKYLWKCGEDTAVGLDNSVFKTAYEHSASCKVAQWEIDIYILVHALLAQKWLRETGVDDPSYHQLAQRTIAQQVARLSSDI